MLIYKNELYNENFPLGILLTEQKLNGYSLPASNLLGHSEPRKGNIWTVCKFVRLQVTVALAEFVSLYHFAICETLRWYRDCVT